MEKSELTEYEREQDREFVRRLVRNKSYLAYILLALNPRPRVFPRQSRC